MRISKCGFALGFANLLSGVTEARFQVEYIAAVKRTILPFEGEFICQSLTSRAAVNLGHVGHFAFIMGFPSAAQALSWFKSDAYQTLASRRNRLWELTIFVCEGSGERAQGVGTKGYAFGTAELKVPQAQIDSDYGTKVAPILAEHGGCFAAKCRAQDAIASEGHVKDFGFVLEFPPGQIASRWYHSQAYQGLSTKRAELMEINIVVIDDPQI